MINALHLLWIVPLAAAVGYAVGYFVCVFRVIRKDVDIFEGRDDV